MSSFLKNTLTVGLFGALVSCSTSKTIPNTESAIKDQNSEVRFSIVGDLPYNPTQAYSLNKFITPALKNSKFVIHIGDFKAGSNQACSPELDQNHLAWMRSVAVPVFYLPGDNDWADCDRKSNAPVIRETERLKELRARFFNPDPIAMPVEWSVERQAGAPENAMWVYNNVRFATANIIGGNNGRDTIEPCAIGTICDSKTDIASLVELRERQSLEWITSIFDKAKFRNSNAVVIAIHGDPFDVKHEGVECTNSTQVNCDGFKVFRQAIIDGASDFRKPVLLVHGDTGPYCWDRKMGGSQAPNLVRLNSAGDYVLIDAVDVVFDPKLKIPFVAKGTISELLPAENQCHQN